MTAWWYRASVLCAGLLMLGATRAPQPAAFDAGLAAFWAASSEKDVARAIEQIVQSGASFDEVYARLAAGRSYSPDVPRGEFRWPLMLNGGAALPTTILIPRDYDPHTRYPVRVYLHGGVMREAPPDGAGRAPRRRLECGESCIGVYPTGSADATWWSATQIESIERTLTRLKRTYNVDENRIHVMGVSDGGTGVYFAGLRDATPWSALFPFNGHLGVLANPTVGTDGDLYLTNLVNTPLYIINGGQDPMYPVSAVEPWVALLQRAGASVTFRPQMTAGHDTSWWPAEGPLVDAFAREHARDPLPDRLSWQTERTDRYNRFRWLVIDSLDATRSDDELADFNTLERPVRIDFGFRIDSRRDARRVIEVIAGSDAAAMGLRKGDLLIEMDGRPIRTAEDIGRAFAAHAQRSPMGFLVERDGRRLQMQTDFPPLPAPVRREPAFEHRKPSGRVDLERLGNVVQARTRGVGTFTLLLSSSEFRFDQPIRITVNGQTVFDGIVRTDVATLLRWAARDLDRTMLFGSAVKVEVPRAMLSTLAHRE